MAGASEPVPGDEEGDGEEVPGDGEGDGDEAVPGDEDEDEAVPEQRLTLDPGGRGPSVQNCL